METTATDDFYLILFTHEVMDVALYAMREVLFALYSLQNVGRDLGAIEVDSAAWRTD
jgi:hypothetical protein